MRQIMTEWFDAGKNLGVIIGGADAGMKHLMAAGGGAVAKEFEKDPKFLDALLAGLAKRIDAVSMPAAQTDPELVGIARSSFQDGYGEGVAQIQLKFDMMYVASTAAIVLSGQIAGAVEMAGAKALQVATTRWRSLPIFVPAGAGGVAGVVRLPKVPVPAAKPAPAPAPAAAAKPAPPPPAAQTTRTVTRNKTTGQIVPPTSTRTTTRPRQTPAAELKPYKEGAGHHVPAKRAFDGAPGYDPKKALAIPNAELNKLGIKHDKVVTPAQRTAYMEFAKTGQPLTWEAIAKIETDVLVKSGMTLDMASATVAKAIKALKDAGVAGPVRIPWGK